MARRGSVYARVCRGVDSTSSQGDGCVIVKTKQAILVTEYNAPIQAPESTTIVENLADYLISVSY